jgi:hypothetical protein
LSVVAEGTARIRHAETGVVYEIHPDELDWQEVAGEERQMGMEVGYLAQIDHPDLGALEWELWEYPVGAFNDRDVNVGRHTLLDNFSISLGGSPEPADEPDGDKGIDEESDEFRDKVAVLVAWFRERYEDPAERTSYESAEGGYLWNSGGPYDAREVLGDEFPDDDAVLDAAVGEIERDGIYEWASAPGYEDEPDDGERDGFRDEEEEPPGPVDQDQVLSEPMPELVLGQRLFRVVRAVPPPQSGPRFEPDASGRIELSGWVSGEDGPQPASLALLPHLREGAQDLADALGGTNAHQHLLREVERYRAAVGKLDLTIEEFYARGVRLENTDFTVAAEIASGETPPLSSEVKAALQSLLHVHASAIMSDQRGRAFVSGAIEYRRPSGATADAQAAAKSFANAVGNAGHIVGPAAREAINEAAETLGAGPNPERSTQVAAGVLARILRGFGAALKFADSGMMGRITWEILKGTVVMSGLLGAATGELNHVLAFLLEQVPNLVVLAPLLATEIPWLQQFTEVLGSMRRSLDARHIRP